MICSLILGRKGSVGFPGKNLVDLLGHPVAWYPMNASNQSGVVNHAFVSTDDPKLMSLGREMGFEVIERPKYLCTNTALGEDAYQHGAEVITERIGEEPELLVLFFANAPTVSPQHIREGVQVLRNRPELDSAVTVSRYNMWSPLRARKTDDRGLLVPFVPFDNFSDLEDLNCDRDSQGEVLFADVALSIIRPSNLQTVEDNMLPQKWMGTNIFPIQNEAGLDIDFEWQLPQAEWWLRRFGLDNT
jgi:CMP-N-acetylneuraminic acid synthetase